MHVSPPKHLARRGGRADLAKNPEYVLESLIGLAVVVIMVTVVANLPDRSESSATPSEQAPDTTAGSLPARAPMSGNLVTNWSFEQDLGGWELLGAAVAAREPQGRTSGSCASVRARGPQPGRVGLRLPAAVKDAPKGSRYVANAWVRSTAPGLDVTVRLVGAGAQPEASQATTTTLPGSAWRAVMVDHTVAATSELAMEVTAEGVAPGDALLVDEVAVVKG
jgi:hypothetical protein